MTQHEPLSRHAAHPSRDATHRRAGRIVHFALYLTAFLICCWMAYGFGKFWAERRLAQRRLAEPTIEAPSTNPLAPNLPLAGLWSFAELDWSMRSHIMSQQEVAQRFEALAATKVPQGDAQLPDVSQDMVELAETLQIRPTERHGNRIYRLNQADLKAQFVVRVVAGQPKAVSLAAAYPHSQDEWQLFEFTPRAATADAAASNRPTLLPVPAGAHRSGGRFADDGTALLELISLDSNSDELFATWKTAGWEVRPTGLGDATQFSYLCARGDDVIYAWSADSHLAVRNLMLVRTPDELPTSPNTVGTE